MSIALHNLTDVGLKLQEIIESSDGDFSKALTDFQTEFNEKVLSCGAIYRNYIAEAEVYEAESKRLKERAEVINRRAEGLRKYVEQQMSELGIDKIKGGVLTVKWRKLPQVVVIEDETKISAEYLDIIPQSVKPNKIRLLEALANGVKVEGCHLETDRRKLEIK